MIEGIEGIDKIEGIDGFYNFRHPKSDPALQEFRSLLHPASGINEL